MHYKSCLTLILAALLAVFLPIQNALGQTNSYKQTNLVSDTSGSALNVDPLLINPWGVAYFPNQPFWVSDNNSGYSTLYNQTGMPSGMFLVPAPTGSGHSSTPTGIVANLAQTGFNVNGKTSLFIFDTEDGTISGWNGTDPVTLKVDNSHFCWQQISILEQLMYLTLDLTLQPSPGILRTLHFRQATPLSGFM
jgi:hypothetical protein